MKKGMEKISEAVLDKVKVEAKNIIKEAENKAREGVKKAKQQQAARLMKEKDRMIGEAEGEATHILAEASIKARQELVAAKTEVIDEISSRVKKALSDFSGDESSLLNLIKEAVGILGINKARVYVSLGDINTVKKLLKRDKELAGKITEIKEVDCTGGAIVEDIDGKVRIDNTYETRLEMLLPRLLPEINKELFKGL